MHLLLLPQYWAFHHYNGLPTGSGIEMEPKVPPRASAVLCSVVHVATRLVALSQS